MQDSNISNLKSQISNSHIAFLWDESFLWGLMAYKALKGLGLSFDLVTCRDIQNGILDNCKMLFVPGGWASNKSMALGESGIKAIREFVENGGNYLGFCGGAGLATTAKGGIGLLNIRRRPTKERVPSFSGRIELNITPHVIWGDYKQDRRRTADDGRRLSNIFHAWWPSQFIIEDDTIDVLATYESALPDAFSSDLNVGDVEGCGNWENLEQVYGINLDPERLNSEPSVVEGRYGQGKVILSLVHFDTPDDLNGQRVLVRLWEYLANCRAQNTEHRTQTTENREMNSHSNELLKLCTELISLGERNFLWFWRNPMLLQWRRGVRGLEYNTLYIMMKEIDQIIDNNRQDVVQYAPAVEKVRDVLLPFIEKAKNLLILERYALQRGHITYDKCDDPAIKHIRNELFSDSKSYGGVFKEIIDEMDSLLISLIRGQASG